MNDVHRPGLLFMAQRFSQRGELAAPFPHFDVRAGSHEQPDQLCDAGAGPGVARPAPGNDLHADAEGLDALQRVAADGDVGGRNRDLMPGRDGSKKLEFVELTPRASRIGELRRNPEDPQRAVASAGPASEAAGVPEKVPRSNAAPRSTAPLT